jgi:ligand-binding sensor domain-containing protein
MALKSMRFIIYLVFAFIVSRPLSAQQFFFKNYSLEQGLVQSQVNDIAQDQDGFLWICTNGGVSRFDGQNFINYSVLNGLTDNQVITVTIRPKNQIWFGTLGAICLKEKNTFIPYHLPNTHKDAYILSVLTLSDTVFWVGTDKNGILEFNTITKKFKILDGTQSIDLVRSLYQDSENKVWVCSKSGVFTQSKLYVWEKKVILGLSEEIKPSNIIEFKKHHYMISTFGQGLVEMNPSGMFVHTQKQGLISNSIRKIVKTRDEKFWFLSKAGISVWDQMNFRNYTTQSGMPNQSAEVLFEDSEGNYWIGTDGKGLLRFTGEEIKVYSTRSGFCSDLPMAFCEDKNGMNVGTYDQGLCELKSKPSYPRDSENRIWDLHIDRRAWLWKATSKGIEIIGKATNILNLKEITSKGVNCISEDDRGDIWMGDRQGLLHWTLGKKEALQIIGVGERIRAISIFKNYVWTGSNQGLFCIQKQDDSIKKERVLPPFDQGKNEITALVATKDTIWIGTTYGLYVYSIQDKKFKSLYFSSNYSSNVINSMVQDAVGDVWCGTNYGVFLYSCQRFKGFIF